MRCCFAPPRDRSKSSVETYAPVPASDVAPGEKDPKMLARIIQDLSGLGIDEDYEIVTHSDGEEGTSGGNDASRAAPRDAAHLTAAASPQPAPPTSTTQPPTSPSQPLSARWNALIGGAKNLLDNLIDLGSSDEEERPSSGRAPPTPPGPSTAGYPTVAASDQEEDGEEAAPTGNTTAPIALVPPEAQPLPEMSEPSGLMTDAHVRALAAEVPARYRQCRWELAYSTQRDGVSLQTMLRNARGHAPTVLVVRDMGRAVFGAYCSESWRQSPHYFGTGETFVFQLAPRAVAWHWWWRKMGHTHNDYFMWGERGAIAVGGAGGYALRLDADLARGISRNSITFGNDSLASGEEFDVGAVEMWWLK